MRKKTILLLIAATAVIFAASCGEDPANPVDDIEDPMWPDMTNRDDVIKTVVLAYASPRDGESISKYNALLHSQYFFGLSPEDVPVGDPTFLTRAEDIESTEFLFANSTILELTISPEEGSWSEHPDLEGETCTECFLSQRQYFMRVQLGDGTTIYQSPPDRAFAVFIVAPDENDSSKWVLRALYDLGI